VGDINYAFFYSSFKGSVSLTYVRFSAGERNLVNTWAKHWVDFFFSRSENLFKDFQGFENDFNILLS
jgi:hypothetical protein